MKRDVQMKFNGVITLKPEVRRMKKENGANGILNLKPKTARSIIIL